VYPHHGIFRSKLQASLAQQEKAAQLMAAETLTLAPVSHP